MGKTSAERQREWLRRKKAKGFVTLTIMVPITQAADVRNVCRRLARDGDLEIGALRNVRTGRLVTKD